VSAGSIVDAVEPQIRALLNEFPDLQRRPQHGRRLRRRRQPASCRWSDRSPLPANRQPGRPDPAHRAAPARFRHNGSRFRVDPVGALPWW